MTTPWKPGMSRRFKHSWGPYTATFDQTCAHCNLRRLRGDARNFHRWYYKQSTWSDWQAKPSLCALRPDAPKGPRKYERRA